MSVVASAGVLSAASGAAEADSLPSGGDVQVTSTTPQSDALTSVQNSRTMYDYLTAVYNDVSSSWTTALTAAGQPFPILTTRG